MGMTAEQYWEGDCTLVVYYRRAEHIRNDRSNRMAWLQGLYIYEALCDVAPVLQAFAKKGTKPRPYSEEPYALSADAREDKEEREEKKKYDKGLDMMKALMKLNNARFEKSEDKEVSNKDG